jgi:hypothetical protein
LICLERSPLRGDRSREIDLFENLDIVHIRLLVAAQRRLNHSFPGPLCSFLSPVCFLKAETYKSETKQKKRMMMKKCIFRKDIELRIGGYGFKVWACGSGDLGFGPMDQV